MNSILNVSLAVFGLAYTLAAFGGETWSKGSQPLLERITKRGWIALFCLVMTFSLGIAKELVTRNALKEAAAKQAKHDADAAKQMADINDRLNILVDVRTAGLKKNVAMQPLNPVTNSSELLAETLNVAVSIALSAEEKYTGAEYQQALARFLEADKLADVAAIKARIADSYFALGDYEAAAKYEELAIKLAPQWSGPPFRLAESLIQLGRLNDAAKQADRSCALGFEEACKLRKKIDLL